MEELPLREGHPEDRGANNPEPPSKGLSMNKLLAALVASLFAVSTAFAASHAGAPMAGASGAKKEEKATAKTEKKDAKADKKDAKATKKDPKADAKAEKKS